MFRLDEQSSRYGKCLVIRFTPLSHFHVQYCQLEERKCGGVGRCLFFKIRLSRYGLDIWAARFPILESWVSNVGSSHPTLRQSENFSFPAFLFVYISWSLPWSPLRVCTDSSYEWTEEQTAFHLTEKAESTSAFDVYIVLSPHLPRQQRCFCRERSRF